MAMTARQWRWQFAAVAVTVTTASRERGNGNDAVAVVMGTDDASADIQRASMRRSMRSLFSTQS